MERRLREARVPLVGDLDEEVDPGTAFFELSRSESLPPDLRAPEVGRLRGQRAGKQGADQQEENRRNPDKSPHRDLLPGWLEPPS